MIKCRLFFLLRIAWLTESASEWTQDTEAQLWQQILAYYNKYSWKRYYLRKLQSPIWDSWSISFQSSCVSCAQNLRHTIIPQINRDVKFRLNIYSRFRFTLQESANTLPIGLCKEFSEHNNLKQHWMR